MITGVGTSTGIPVRNIWLLMLYAADSRAGLSKGKVQSEQLEDSIPDLVGALLSDEVERRYRNKFSIGYEKVVREEARLRGRVRLLDSARTQSARRGKIVCEFERLTHDTPANRYALRALMSIAKLSSDSTRHQIYAAASLLQRLGVGGVHESHSVPPRFSIDRRDQRMVALAKLALEMQIPSEETGLNALYDVEQNDVWLRQLYEKAIGGFYRFHLDGALWKVETSKKLTWPADDQTGGFSSYMPTMKSDIEITDRMSGQKTVIDTKFTSISKSYLGNERFKSGHLYQIYAYLRSQEQNPGSSLVAPTRGVLLYPEIGSSVHEAAVIQGHKVELLTIDLASDFKTLKASLLSLFAG
jgi:5-methylcytosine-specific restriction enzyme subunit McrC